MRPILFRRYFGQKSCGDKKAMVWQFYNASSSLQTHSTDFKAGLFQLLSVYWVQFIVTPERLFNPG
jgi:hypothetical protein